MDNGYSFLDIKFAFFSKPILLNFFTSRSSVSNPTEARCKARITGPGTLGLRLRAKAWTSLYRYALFRNRPIYVVYKLCLLGAPLFVAFALHVPNIEVYEF